MDYNFRLGISFWRRNFFMAYMAFASTLDNSALAISLVTLSESVPDFTSFLTGYFCDRTKKKYQADIFCAFVRAFLYVVVACFLQAPWDGGAF